MGRRRYRRRKNRKGKEPGLIEGLLVAAVALAFLQSWSPGAGGLSIDLPALFINVLLFGLLVLVVVGLVFIAKNGFKSFLAKLARGKLFRSNYTVDDLIALHPREFEHYIGGLYENQGYTVEAVTQYSADHGIDLILRKEGKRYAVQTKRYSGRNYVKAHEMREFYGSYTGDSFDGGIFVTTSYFGKQARAWAEERGIVLVDRPALDDLVYRFEL